MEVLREVGVLLLLLLMPGCRARRGRQPLLLLLWPLGCNAPCNPIAAIHSDRCPDSQMRWLLVRRRRMRRGQRRGPWRWGRLGHRPGRHACRETQHRAAISDRIMLQGWP